jgi:hypothetical protein
MHTTNAKNDAARAQRPRCRANRSRRLGISIVPCGLLLGACCALLAIPGPAVAQDSRTQVHGSIGIGGTLIDETGSRSLVQERSDLFEGFSARYLDLHVLTPQSVRIDVVAPRIDPVARDARLSVSSHFVNGSLRTASSQFIFDPSGALKSHRDLVTADLRVRPMQHVELFGEHTRIDLGGRRQAIVPGDEGELGDSYDQDASTWRGGVRLKGLRSTLEVGYLGRELRSDAFPSVDRHLHGVQTALRTRPYEQIEATGFYDYTLSRRLSDGTKLESHRVSGRADYVVKPGLRVGPLGRYEQTTDRSLYVQSHIWALGAGVRASNPRGWCDLEGEAGRRENRLGTADIWGLRANGSLNVVNGVQLKALYQRRERDRQGVSPPQAPTAPLPDIVGTLAAQRVEGRLHYRPVDRFSIEGLVARFDKNYDDVQVEQQTWRYGIQGTARAPHDVQIDAGWRLDDTFDTRTTGRYDLRTHVVYGGAAWQGLSRLSLRGRVDYYTMQRSLDEWKVLVSTGAEVRVIRDLFLGLEYARNQFEESVGALDTYKGNVWQFTLRQAFDL